MATSYPTVPEAALAALTATDASPTLPVAASAGSTACTVASQPEALAWSRMALGPALGPSLSSESMCSRRASGRASLTRLLLHAPGRHASVASWEAGSGVSVGPGPYARARSHTGSPAEA